MINDAISRFESRTGIQVKVTLYSSSEEMFQKLSASGGAGFDVVYPEAVQVPILVGQGLLAPWGDLSNTRGALLPHILFASDQIGGMVDGERFAVPVAWSTEAMGGRPDVVAAGSEASYETLWNTALMSPITFRPRTALFTAGLLLQDRREIDSFGLVYRDEAVARDILGKATSLVISTAESRPHKFWGNPGEYVDAFASNQVDAGQIQEFAGFELLMKLGSDEFRFVTPREGGVGWIDGISLSAGVKNRAEADEWLRFSLEPETAAQLVNSTGYNSSSAGAISALPEVRRNYLNSVHATIIAASTGGGNDPCSSDTCRCGDGTCSKECCESSSIIGNVFWRRLEPAWLVGLMLESADRIAAA